jgi:phosphatidylglycerol:prolipoprotein diacylglycerol transferase
MDPVIFSFNIGSLNLALRWYGVLVMAGIIFSAWLTTVELKRRKEDPEWIWDMLIWLVVGGIIGARLWYVLNATLGGSPYYLDNPIKIIMIPEGGLHYYGAMIGGALALFFYARAKKLDIWLFIDSVAPALLLGQALSRPANFINQELYGPPTTLPWGIKIDALHRIGDFRDLITYPLDTTRFHPTFAYEMIWNIITGGLMLWLGRKYDKKLKPGAMFSIWLILAGVGRVIIETWRPDQPTFPGSTLSYTRFVAILMAIAGVLAMLYLYKVIKLPFLKEPREKYFVSDGFPMPEEQPKKKKNASTSKKKSSTGKKKKK